VLNGYDFAARPVSGQKVTLGIRPEHIKVEENGDWDGFTTELVETHGADNLIWAGRDGLSLRIRLPGEKKLSLGTPLTLSLDTSRISLFDTQTSIRI